MKIGNFTFGMRGHDLADNFDDMVRNAVENDIRHLQFSPGKTLSDVNFTEAGYDDALAGKMAKALKDNDLNVSVLGCYIDPISPETLESQLTLFENFILYAKALGAKVIGTETGYINTVEETHSEKTFGVFLNSLERLLKVAEKNGVTIAIEPVWLNPVCTVSVMRGILDRFKSDNLKVIFDPNNLLNENNYKEHRKIIDEGIDVLGDDISILHLKDFIFTDRFTHLSVGDGQFDAKYCLEKLSQLKNIPEIMLDGMPLSELPKVTENLKKIIL